jgi:hypothetical protein
VKRDLTIYVAILVVAVAIQYVIELQWGAALALDARPLVPWIIDAVLYALLGALAWMTLRSRSLSLRILFLALVAVVPHVMFEITHGSDPAYPYIGLLFIVPDLVWVAIGAGVAAVLAPKMLGSKTS